MLCQKNPKKIHPRRSLLSPPVHVETLSDAVQFVAGTAVSEVQSFVVAAAVHSVHMLCSSLCSLLPGFLPCFSIQQPKMRCIQRLQLLFHSSESWNSESFTMTLAQREKISWTLHIQKNLRSRRAGN